MFGINRRAASYTWTAALILLLLFVIHSIRGTLVVFTVSLLLAYLLYPLVDRLDRYLPTRSRTPALAVIYLFLVGLFAVVSVEIGSQVVEQANSLAQRAPEIVAKMQQQPASGSLPSGVQSIKQTVLNTVRVQLRQHYNDLASTLPKITLEILSASRNLIFLIVVPILSFFILKDGRSIREDFVSQVDSEGSHCWGRISGLVHRASGGQHLFGGISGETPCSIAMENECAG